MQMPFKRLVRPRGLARRFESFRMADLRDQAGRRLQSPRVARQLTMGMCTAEDSSGAEGDGSDHKTPQVEDSQSPEHDGDGHVYMLKIGKHVKIGRTYAVPRRHRQITLELPEKPDAIHSIRTDDPEGIEAFWHRAAPFINSARAVRMGKVMGERKNPASHK